MSTKSKHSPASFGRERGKYTYKLEQLKLYVKKSKYIDKKEQPKICASFELPYLVNVFRAEYRQRFYDYLQERVMTLAMVSKATGIPEKYLCQVKRRMEKKGILKVVYFARCEATGSKGVGFLSTDKNKWGNTEVIPKSNQIKLF